LGIPNSKSTTINDQLINDQLINDQSINNNQSTIETKEF